MDAQSEKSAPASPFLAAIHTGEHPLLRLADGAVHVLDRDHVQGDDNLSKIKQGADGHRFERRWAFEVRMMPPRSYLSIVNHIADELLQLNDTVCLDLYADRPLFVTLTHIEL